ncbi:TetR/AcrR family transcriptional regulator (plasmid) [Haloferacaceae archaeon DSL9]
MPSDVPPAARKEVATAVRSALAKHGYADLTTNLIAAETEKSEAFLYYHYDTKDELIAAFLRESVGWLEHRLERIEAEDPDSRLRALCDVLLVADGDETTARVHIAVMELLAHAPYNETLRDPLITYQCYVRDAIASEISRGIEQGTYEEIDPEATASFIHMVLDGSTGSVLALEMDDVGRDVRNRLSAYIDGFRREEAS